MPEVRVKDLLAGETQGIWSMRSTLESDPASSFMQACGFHQEKRQHYYRAEIVSLPEKVRPVLERLRSRGRIPTEMRVVAERDTPLDDLSRLVFSEFGWLPQEAFEGLRLRRLRQESEPDELSIGVMVGKEIAGFILGRAEDGLGVVDANVVAPNYRRGWTNLFQMEAGLRLMISAGLTEFRFHCDDTALDTMNLARLCAANETQRRVLHYQRL